MNHDADLRVVDESKPRSSSPHGARTVTAQNVSVLSKALNEQGLTHVGKAIGRDHTYLSRFRTNEQKISWDELMGILDACGLRLMSAGPDMRVISVEDYMTLLNLANKGMRAINNEVRGEGEGI